MKKITVIGGDNRLKILKNYLEKEGYFVDTLGLFEDDSGDITTSQIIILPVPTTKDKKTVFCPLTNRKILLGDIAESLKNEQLVLCCNYMFENKKCVDYGSLDSYALLNAVPTAEGAIKLAIENTPYTLWQSKVLVIGFGRVGKILSDRLKSLGADVTVSCRKPSDSAMCETLGYKTVHTGNLNKEPLCYDIIFNTVDVKVIDDTTFKNCGCDLIIDLSSKGGFSLDAANEYRVKAIKAPGLPALIAPVTAAEILNRTVNQIINSY